MEVGVGDLSDTVPGSPVSPGYGPLLSPLEEEDTGALEGLERELSSIRCIRHAVLTKAPLRVQFLLTCLMGGGKSKKLWLY